MGRARRGVGSGALVLALALAAGCGSTLPPGPAWSAVRLPSGFTPSSITATGAGLLVGSDADTSGTHPPRLALVHDGTATPVPVRATTPYGTQALWHDLVAAGGTVYGIGGRSGGAHGNVRWTAWAGTVSPPAVTEEEQGFETFGGPDAGSLVAVVVTRSGAPLLVGSRVAPDHTGLDIAVWDHAGHLWTRRPSAGTGLAAGPDQQPSVAGAAARGAGTLILGAVTSVHGRSARTTPAVWISATAAGPWKRVDLPVSGGTAVSDARSAACDPDGSCLLVGHAGRHLAAWSLSATGTARALHLPAVRTTADARVVARSSGDRAAIAAGGRVLLGDGEDWRSVAGPGGAITGFAVLGTTWWATTGSGTHARLWSVEQPD